MLVLKMQLQLQLMTLQQKLTSHRQHAVRIQQQLLPKAKTLLDDTQKAYEQGKYSVLQWVDAQAKHFDLQQALIESLSGFYFVLLELYQ